MQLRSAQVAVAILAVIVVLSALGPSLAPQSPLALNTGALYRPAGAASWYQFWASVASAG